MIIFDSRNPSATAWPRGLLICTLLAVLAACGEPPTAPEEELRNWVASGVEAAEAKERRRLVGMISPAYADSRGNDRNAVGNILRAYFMRMNNVQLVTSIEDIRVIGDSAAEVVIKVGMAGTHDGVLGFSADAYRFAFELERDGDDWLLIAARWGELGKELR
jgi:hypothetical protein